MTYEGVLLGASRGSTRAQHKHALRRCFHKQLAHFWNSHPDLNSATVRDSVYPNQFTSLPHYLRQKFRRGGYEFIPLVTAEWSLSCSIHILLLRQGVPGRVMQSGDIDNRLKTVFDALRIPSSPEELAACGDPGVEETPFYCLLEDDKLIAGVSIEADALLAQIGDTRNDNDARLVITADIKPQRGTLMALTFI